MANVGKLFVVMGIDGKQFNREIRNTTSKASGAARSIQTRFDSINMKKAVLSVAAFGTAVGYASMKLVGMSSDAAETRNKFGAVFRELTGDAQAWAKNFSKSVGRSNTDVQAWMSTLQDTFVPLGFAREKGAELSKSLVQLAVDVGSFQNKADASVIEDFTSALVGNHETVRKYGIVITEARLKEEALSQGITTKVMALSEAEKAQLRYSIILKGTADAQGDAAKTALEYENQTKKGSANLQKIAETAGDKLKPVFTDVLVSFNQWVDTNQTFINQKIDEYVGRIGNMLSTLSQQKGVFTAIGEGALQFAENIVTIADNMKFLYDAGRYVVQNPQAIIDPKGFIAGQGARAMTPPGYKDKNPWWIPQPPEQPTVAISQPVQAAPVKRYSGVSLTPGIGGAGTMSRAQEMLRGPGFTPGQEMKMGTTMFNAKTLEMVNRTTKAVEDFGTTATHEVTTVNAAWLSVGNTMSNVLANAVTQSGDAMGNIIRGFKGMLAQMAAELASKAAVFSVLNMLSGGGFSAGVGGLKRFLGFGQMQVPAFAGGGYAYGPTLAFLGERGRERVLNHQETKEWERGKGAEKPANVDNSVINITISGGNVDALKQMTAMELGERILEAKRKGYLKGM